MNNIDLPSLPSASSSGPEVCAIVRLYMAVWDDLAPVQKRQVAAHVQTCADCTREQRMFKRATQLAASLEASEPSARVDQAVLAAIAARRAGSEVRMTDPLQPAVLPFRKKRRGGLPAVAWIAAAAAILFLATFATFHFFPGGFPGSGGGGIATSAKSGGGGIATSAKPGGGGIATSAKPDSSPIAHSTPPPIPTSAPVQAFAIPANVSWDPYVLYHTQTEISSAGQSVQVAAYHDMSSGNLRVETMINGKMDVVMVEVNQKALGMDMMHNVATWGANAWSTDESMFNLKQLRQDLQSGRAVYKGTTTFNGQKVYQILWGGDILLLNMQYAPVNVLVNARSSGTGAPIYKAEYDTFQVLQSSKVPDSTWDQTIPAKFKMGALPQKPKPTTV